MLRIKVNNAVIFLLYTHVITVVDFICYCTDMFKQYTGIFMGKVV